MKPFEEDPKYPLEELRFLVTTENMLVFPIRNAYDRLRLNDLDSRQYARKIALYVSTLRNIN